MNKATEVMMQYVENLKRTYEKDHAELMEFKKLANQNSNRCYGGSVDTGGKTTQINIKPTKTQEMKLGKPDINFFHRFHGCKWKELNAFHF